MWKEFKEFAVKGNVVDMAVGIIIGAAFGTIITALVAEVLMPPIGLLLGNVDFANLFIVLKEGKLAGPYATVAAAKGAGAVTLNYGLFVNTVVNFLIVAFAIFFLIRGAAMNRHHARGGRNEGPVDRYYVPDDPVGGNGVREGSI